MTTKLDIETRFRRFHENNPHVYANLVRMARSKKVQGRKVGIRMLWEVLRYDGVITDGDGYKLSNDFHSRYARIIMANEPDLKGYFRLRPLRNEREIV